MVVEPPPAQSCFTPPVYPGTLALGPPSAPTPVSVPLGPEPTARGPFAGTSLGPPFAPSPLKSFDDLPPQLAPAMAIATAAQRISLVIGMPPVRRFGTKCSSCRTGTDTGSGNAASPTFSFTVTPAKCAFTVVTTQPYARPVVIPSLLVENCRAGRLRALESLYHLRRARARGARQKA